MSTHFLKVNHSNVCNLSNSNDVSKCLNVELCNPFQIRNNNDVSNHSNSKPNRTRSNSGVNNHSNNSHPLSEAPAGLLLGPHPCVAQRLGVASNFHLLLDRFQD